jgi:eukaryotic-like serine/threonine-protein kinase
MDATRWARIRSLFHGALDERPSERQTFLEQQCSDDATLLQEVTALLKAHEEEGTFLDQPLVHLDGNPQSGEHVGIYALQNRLGQGGMGTVYRAVRADGEYESEVALKVMHAGLGGEDLVGRFRQERQILANLQHPNIARLLDGGTTAGGRPFLVMEYVEGEAIDHYCEAQDLTVSQRLRLFQKVCNAVHFAHQHLVVHRDLKPANILVTAEGEPKLLDFGIAKLLEPYTPVGFTETGSASGGAPMTPENASPEQMGKGPITTASDIYSLGVLLYQLLAGRRPFRMDELGTEAFVRAVCHQDPPPPSIHRSGAAAALMRGDLDAITAMALRKEPRRRYPSAEEFSRDLERHLVGRPVLARESTLAYRAGKFLRRHRWPVAAATAALLLLSGFTGALLVQRHRILQEQALSTEATRFLEGLFEISNPDRAHGERVTARELLDRGALDIQNRLEEQPELKADLLATMGRVYRKLGLYPEAEPLLLEAYTLRRQSYGTDHHPKVAESLVDLGEQRTSTGRYGEAVELFQQALACHARGELTVRALSGQADALRRQGQYGPAEALQRQALQKARETLGPDHTQVAQISAQLGTLLREKGDHGAASRAYQEALEIELKLHGRRHPEVARLYNNMGLLAQERGDFETALGHFETALAIQGEVLEEGHRETAAPHHNRAAVLDEMGQYEAAEAACRTALEIRRRTLGEHHPNLADSLNLLGLIRFHRGDWDEAADLLGQALAMWTDLLGADYVKVAAARNNLGQVLLAREALEEAAEQFREALRIYVAAYGQNHSQVAVVLNNLGLVSKLRGDREAARDYYRWGLETTRGLLGTKHPKVATLSHNLAVLLEEGGELAGAEDLHRQALAAFTASLEAGHPNLGMVRKNLASALLGQGKVDEAATVLEEALAIFRAAGVAETDAAVLVSRGLLGECRARQGRFAEAKEILTAAHALAEQHFGSDHAITRRAKERLEDYGRQ